MRGRKRRANGEASAAGETGGAARRARTGDSRVTFLTEPRRSLSAIQFLRLSLKRIEMATRIPPKSRMSIFPHMYARAHARE